MIKNNKKWDVKFSSFYGGEVSQSDPKHTADRTLHMLLRFHSHTEKAIRHCFSNSLPEFFKQLPPFHVTYLSEAANTHLI